MKHKHKTLHWFSIREHKFRAYCLHCEWYYMAKQFELVHQMMEEHEREKNS